MGRFTDDDHDFEMEGADLLALEGEIPILAGLRSFSEEAVHLPWFSQLSRPIDKETRALARSYLDGLGLPQVEVARLRDWEEASDAALSLDIDTAQWEAEESLRAHLAAEALMVISEEALSIALTHMASLLGERLGNAIRDAAAFWEVEDEGLMDAAAGDAMRTVHSAALALVTGAEYDHPFRRKLALFARGRWPIGVAGMTLNFF